MRIAILTFIAAASLVPSNAMAQVMEYVRVCDAFGTGYYYSPGTETCVNATTGVTKKDSIDGTITGETDVLRRAKDATEGVALSMALPNASVDDGKTFGAAMNFGTFNGENALGVSGAIQPMDGLTLNGAFGGGFGRGTAGVRAGVNYSW